MHDIVICVHAWLSFTESQLLHARRTYRHDSHAHSIPSHTYNSMHAHPHCYCSYVTR